MKILLVNERVKHENVLPSLGLLILGTIAQKKGHRVKVIDYQITTEAPPLVEYVKYLKPDIVGIRIVNENWANASEKITEIRPLVKTLIVGGPFPTLHYQDLRKDPRIDAIFVAEAEDTFTQFLYDIEYNHILKIYFGFPTDIYFLPVPDFTLLHNYRKITHYPLQTSRGCPYDCSFCMTKLINSKRWRNRSVEIVLAETLRAIEILPKLERMVIIDDNPTNHPNRFNHLLKRYLRYIKENNAPSISVLNVRADTITPKVAQLLAKCGCNQVVLGVETTNQNAMKILGKQIKLSDVKQAITLLRNEGISVGGSFIIGLPMDDWKSVNKTIHFAKDSGFHFAFWGHLLPCKGTRARKYVKVLNDHAPTMISPKDGSIIEETGSETKQLPEWWQIKAWLRASIINNPRSMVTRWNPIPTLKIFWESVKYAETHTFFRASIPFVVRWFLGKQKVMRCGNVSSL
jgi:radical SAM superfamily enzyme YgiQ (UPF0313 family)